MNQFCQLLEKYDRLVIFDTETTGLQWNRNQKSIENDIEHAHDGI